MLTSATLNPAFEVLVGREIDGPGWKITEHSRTETSKISPQTFFNVDFIQSSCSTTLLKGQRRTDQVTNGIHPSRDRKSIATGSACAF